MPVFVGVEANNQIVDFFNRITENIYGGIH